MKTKLGAATLGLLIAALAAGGSPAGAVSNASDQRTGLRPIVKTSVRQDVLRNLAAAPVIAAPVATGAQEEMPRFPRKSSAGRAADSAAATATSAQGSRLALGRGDLPATSALDTGGLASPEPSVNFEGINRTDHVANRFLPPDTQGAAGADFYVQQVNVTFAIYDKKGNKVLGPLPQATIWAGLGAPCETTEGGDGVTLYDHYANRFLFTKLAYPTGVAQGPFFQCLAVSVTADPTGAWNRYVYIISDEKFNDYPKFGIWPDGYYYTVNQFVDIGKATERLAGVGAGVFERDKMLLGLPARVLLFDTEPLGLDIANMLPSDADGPILPPAGSPNFFVNMKNTLLSDNESTVPQPTLQLWQLQVDWRAPNNSSFSGPTEIQTMSFNPVFNPEQCSDPDLPYPTLCIPQPPVKDCPPVPNVPKPCPDPNQKLDALQDRLMARLQYRRGYNSTFGEFESLISNHTVNVGGDTNRAGFHWWQLIQTPSRGWDMYQQGIYAGASPNDKESRWMASAAMDEAENVVVGYSVSSPKTYPSIRYNGRMSTDLPGRLLQGERTIVEGSGAQGHPRGRWGDYSAMVLDPLDDCTFWYTTEYGKVSSPPFHDSRSNWATRVAAFHFDTCGQRNTH